MAKFSTVADAYIASRELDNATLGRIAFWTAHVGDREVEAITTDDIDAGLIKLAERGKLRAGRNFNAETTGKPLAPATMNRYLAQAGTIFLHARRMRLVKRTFVRPTTGIEREREHANPDKYLRPEEVARLIAVAPVIDTHWRKMRALIVVLFHTGLRVGSIMKVRGKDLDLKAGTMSVPEVTKNGDPIVAALSTDAIAELKKLPRVAPEELVFGSRWGKPFKYTRLFAQVAKEARLPGRTVHWLRHGHGAILARQGVSQQMIMASMGHRTLKASARYAHHNTSDKAHVIAKVFG